MVALDLISPRGGMFAGFRWGVELLPSLFFFPRGVGWRFLAHDWAGCRCDWHGLLPSLTHHEPIKDPGSCHDDRDYYRVSTHNPSLDENSPWRMRRESAATSIADLISRGLLGHKVLRFSRSTAKQKFLHFCHQESPCLGLDGG